MRDARTRAVEPVATRVQCRLHTGLTRTEAVMLGNAGTLDDVDVLTRAPDDEEPLVREHARWALARLRRQCD